MNRFSASAWHLLGSALVASVCALLVFSVWYPGGFAYASGVSEIFLLLVVIDVVLGPLLTLIIFNPRKKELRRDLCVVVFLQLAALTYGVYSVFIARPAFAVFNAGRFDLVYANEISEENFAEAGYSDYSSAPLWGPKFVSAKLPENESKAKEIVLQAVAGGDDIQNYPQYFQVLQGKTEALRSASLTLDELKVRNKGAPGLQYVAKQYGEGGQGFSYVPVFAKSKNVVAVVDLNSEEVLELVPLEPF